MGAVTATVLVGGWWLPGRHIAQGQAVELDAATAHALARRGIVRLPDAPAPEAGAAPAANATPNAGKPARKRTTKELNQ